MDAVSDRMALSSLPLLHDYLDLEPEKITSPEGGIPLHLGNGHFTPTSDLETGEMDPALVARYHGAQIAEHEEGDFFMDNNDHLPITVEWASATGNENAISSHQPRRVQWCDNNGKDLVHLVEFEARYIILSLLQYLNLSTLKKGLCFLMFGCWALFFKSLSFCVFSCITALKQ